VLVVGMAKRELTVDFILVPSSVSGLREVAGLLQIVDDLRRLSPKRNEVIVTSVPALEMPTRRLTRARPIQVFLPSGRPEYATSTAKASWRES
jgi:hypothetical protein